MYNNNFIFRAPDSDSPLDPLIPTPNKNDVGIGYIICDPILESRADVYNDMENFAGKFVSNHLSSVDINGLLVKTSGASTGKINHGIQSIIPTDEYIDPNNLIPNEYQSSAPPANNYAFEATIDQTSSLGSIGLKCDISGLTLNSAGVNDGVYAQVSGGNTNNGVHAIASGSGETNYGINSEAQGTGASTNIAIEGQATTATTGTGSNYSFQGHATGSSTNYGADIIADGSGASTNNYGIKVQAMNGSGRNFGIWAAAPINSTYTGGIFAPLPVANANWAGVFCGDVKVVGTILSQNMTVNTIATNGITSSGEIKVIATDQFTLTGCPDFVFDKTYKVKTLKEVEAYVNSNHHLPNVPSASDIKTNGMDVAGMSFSQLQNLEELYLHVIELNKSVEALKAANEALQAQMNTLIKK